MVRYDDDANSGRTILIAAGLVAGVLAGAAVAQRLGGWTGAKRLLLKRRKPLLALLRASIPSGALSSVLDLVGIEDLIAGLGRTQRRPRRMRRADPDLDEFEVDDFERAAAGLDDDDEPDERGNGAGARRHFAARTADDSNNFEEDDADAEGVGEEEDDEDDEDDRVAVDASDEWEDEDRDVDDQDEDEDEDEDEDDSGEAATSDNWDDELDEDEEDEDEEDEEDEEDGDEEDDLVDDNSPDEIERQVLAAVSRHPVLGQRAIVIAVNDDGLLELGGWVRSAREVRLARRVAQRVPGVSSIDLRLAVREHSASPDKSRAES